MKDLLRAGFEMTKPGITLFIGISAAAGYVAADVPVDVARLTVMLLATMLMSGGAAAANQIIERNHDANMRRTRNRPLPSGRLTLAQARFVSYGATVTGLLLAIVTLPWLATVLLISCHISYVDIYTPMKRRSPLCTLVGAIPGSLPVLAGCAAASGSITPAALALAGVLFTWQIPHFMAIGWLGREDYAGTGCPMLFVIDKTGLQSARVAVLYAVSMLACSYLLAVASPSGMVYAVVATAVCSAYVVTAWRFMRVRERLNARRLFFTSLMALPLLLAAFALDVLAI